MNIVNRADAHFLHPIAEESATCHREKKKTGKK